MTNPTTPVAAELKACPLCHSANVLHDRDGIEFPLSVVWCGDCGCAVADDADCKRVDETPYDRWQARPEPAPVAADVEKVALAITQEIGWGSFSHFNPDDVRRISRAAIAALSSLPSEREQIVASVYQGTSVPDNGVAAPLADRNHEQVCHTPDPLGAVYALESIGIERGKRVTLDFASEAEGFAAFNALHGYFGAHLPTTEQEEG